MIIDSHAHIGVLPPFNMSAKNLLWSTERFGIDFLLFSNIEARETATLGLRRVVKDLQYKHMTKTDPHRVGFCFK